MPAERVRPSVLRFAALVAAASLASATIARAQDFPTIYRGNEVGRSQLDFDEETFLNILSFEQPLETVQPFLAADNGWQLALGSLRSDILWYEQDFKYKAPVTDDFAVRAAIHNGIDLDNDFSQIQAMMELKLSDHWYGGIPVVLGFDKGTMDGGLAFTYRDPAKSVDFIRLQWVRSDIVFNERSDQFPKSDVKTPADNFELQYQADLFGFGKTTLILADETPSKVDFVETQKIEEFSRFHAKLLHAYDWNERQRGFLQGSYEIASENSTPTGPLGAPDAFDGDRDGYQARAEYQHDLDDEHVRRARVGTQYIWFRMDQSEPTAGTTQTDLRREAFFYAGYRTPFMESKTVDVETVVYLERLWAVQRLTGTTESELHIPNFQGKIDFYFRWHMNDRAEFVVSPSFELDKVGWGGGEFALRYRF